jgi:energy-coupling factor transporter ATP-binding protein EcfA2
MYISRVFITNIRSIERLVIDFSKLKHPAGWHVIIGDNATGKSTLIRAIALALVGPQEAFALRQNWMDWLRFDTKSGRIRLDVYQNRRLDKRTGKGKSLTKWLIPLVISIKKSQDESVGTLSKIQIENLNPEYYVWGTGRGWFSASYGPYRRFTGGNKDFEKLYYSNPKLAPHLSAFGEDVALTESIDWLKKLHIQALENKKTDVLEYVVKFLNEGGLLPHGTVLHEIRSDRVLFKDGNECIVPVEQLSDGYRSVLSMTFELIKHMINAYGADAVFEKIKTGEMCIDVPGVVLIDEIDAHLHPAWQRKIGPWFTKYFPQIQFIVTTHSPLVCQAAVEGTIWQLASPGNQIDGGIKRIDGIELARLLYGDILEAYDTQLFGTDITKSQEAQNIESRIAELNIKSLVEELSEEERNELRTLGKIRPTALQAGLGQPKQ